MARLKVIALENMVVMKVEMSTEMTNQNDSCMLFVCAFVHFSTFFHPKQHKQLFSFFVVVVKNNFIYRSKTVYFKVFSCKFRPASGVLVDVKHCCWDDGPPKMWTKTGPNI